MLFPGNHFRKLSDRDPYSAMGDYRKHPQIAASYVWNMFEFAVPMWNRGGVNARNLKG